MGTKRQRSKADVKKKTGNKRVPAYLKAATVTTDKTDIFGNGKTKPVTSGVSRTQNKPKSTAPAPRVNG